MGCPDLSAMTMDTTAPFASFAMVATSFRGCCTLWGDWPIALGTTDCCPSSGVTTKTRVNSRRLATGSPVKKIELHNPGDHEQIRMLPSVPRFVHCIVLPWKGAAQRYFRNVV